MTRGRRLAVVATLLLIAGAGVAWAVLRPRPDPAVERALVATGLDLYVPSLRGAEPTEVRVRDGRVDVQLVVEGAHAWTLHLLPAPEDGDLCVAVDTVADATCEVRGGVLRARYDEQETVALTRGRTVVVLDGLVTEQDPGLAEEAIRALRTAPEVDAGDLAGH